MFTVTNLSNNPLMISDGKVLVAKATRDVASCNERMRAFEQRGWLTIVEVPKQDPPKQDPSKTKGPEGENK